MSIALVNGGMTRVDGLCATCMLPALWNVALSIISPSGVTATRWLYCSSCRLRENPKHA